MATIASSVAGQTRLVARTGRSGERGAEAGYCESKTDGSLRTDSASWRRSLCRGRYNYGLWRALLFDGALFYLIGIKTVIVTHNLSMHFSGKPLFENVSVKFGEG